MKHGARLAIAAAAVLAAPLAQSQSADWIRTSNEHAQILLEVMTEFRPERAAQLGVEGYDRKIMDLRPGYSKRRIEATREAIRKLEQRRQAAQHPKVRQDLDILIEAARDDIRSTQLQREHMLPYFNLPQGLFYSVKSLLDPQIPAERQKAVIARLRKYAGVTEGREPITELARARMSERFDAGLLGPYKDQVKQHLSDAPRMVQGMERLLEKSELDGWQEPFEQLEAQLDAYAAWVEAEILPRARTDHRLPAEIYADNLRNFGVDMKPEKLLRRARTAFVEIRNQMQSLAPVVAKRQDIESTDYRDVIRALKEQQLVGDAILPHYEQRLERIEAIIREQDIVSLPERDASIRLASEAESAASPAPHLQPPRLIGNTGEYAEFVLPLNVPGESGESLKMDDFTFEAASWTLTAHEARPGHELQFASIIEQGVSIPRAVFAFNSANVEGWALYAEAVMQPYEPPEGQLIALQMRLQRAARAFLDPMLNLGMIEPEAARRFIREEVVLSEAMAKQEVDRYTFRMPGQATSYFYGYLKLLDLRAETELAMGDAFDRKAFHDFVLAQGLVPPDILAEAVRREFIGD